MTLQSVMIGDVAIWFADDKPGLGWWHCAAIQPQSSDDGENSSSLIEAGGVLVINCVAQLAPKPDNIAAFSSEFAREMGQTPDDIILSEASLGVREVRLELGSEEEGVEILSRSDSSGMFPFNAVLGATLMNDQAARFKAAIEGEENSGLRVVYDLEVSLPFAVAAIEGRSASTPVGSGESARISMLTTFGDAPASAVGAAMFSARGIADESIAAMVSSQVPGNASTAASYLESGSQSHPIEITADASSWFALP